jgi:dual specificity protein kinase YAK1
MLGEIPDSLLTVSSCWRKFYDMTPSGFQLKLDPTEALMDKHLYAAILKESNATKLSDLLRLKFELNTEEETTAVNCFIHLVLSLLAYDPIRRLTAETALGHPFITGKPFRETWQPAAPPKRKIQPESAPKRSASAGIATVDALKPVDFLSLM